MITETTQNTGSEKISVSRLLRSIPAVYWILILSMLAKLLYYQYATGLNSGSVFLWINFRMVLGTSLTVLILASAAAYFFHKKTFHVLFGLDILISILLLTDITYMRYYGHSLSVFLIFNIDFKFFSAVSEAINKLYEPTDVIFIADIPFIAAARLFFNRQNPGRHSSAKRKASAILLVLASCLLIAMAISIVENYRALPIRDNFAAKNLGVLNGHMEDLYQFVVQNPLASEKLTAEEKLFLQDFMDEKNAQTITPSNQGTFAGKNLLFVQVEALQNFVINRKIGGQEITPNLNKFIGESYYFNNLYVQVAGGNTSDAEFLSNTSLYPVKTGSVYYTYADNTFLSLPQTLRDQGYQTNAFHAFKPHFWNRDIMYKAFGFDRFYSEADYKMDDFAGWNGQVLSDSSFFSQSLDFLGKKKPFYGFFVSVSSHFPFTQFSSYPFDAGPYTGSYIGNYLKAIQYEDQCLGELIEKLSDEGYLEDTIVVIYGDHTAVPKYRSEELLSLAGKENNDYEWTKLQQVPFIIHVPGQNKGQTLSITGGQIDILPTVKNLMGIQPFSLGKDLLNTQMGYAVLRDGSVITDSYMYHAGSGSVYDSKTGQKLDLNDYILEIENYQKELAASDIMIRRDAFAHMNTMKWRYNE